MLPTFTNLITQAAKIIIAGRLFAVIKQPKMLIYFWHNRQVGSKNPNFGIIIKITNAFIQNPTPHLFTFYQLYFTSPNYTLSLQGLLNKTGQRSNLRCHNRRHEEL
jgi:hypothetical protein